MNVTLTFSVANAKLVKLAEAYDKVVKTFSLPSGWTCPGASECLSKADATSGKIKDGNQTQFRCFQASAEALYPPLRNMVWNNLGLLKERKSKAEMAVLIKSSLPNNFDIMRVHVGGDFFSQVYFDAWIEVANLMPEKVFYAYTKSLTFWVARLGSIPKNLSLTASRGGKHDELIDLHHLKCAEVVFSIGESEQKGLEIDHDDSHAVFGNKSFALLIHGTQPKGSKASKALQALKKVGVKGYSAK